MAGSLGQQSSSWYSLIFSTLLRILVGIFILTALSFVVFVLFLQGPVWLNEQPWRTIDRAALKEFLDWIWNHRSKLSGIVEFAVQYVTYILAVLAALYALAKVDKIAKLIEDLRDGNARSTIMGLVHSASEINDRVKALTPALEKASSAAAALETASKRIDETVGRLERLLNEKVDDILEQIGQLDRSAVTERENDPALPVVPATPAVDAELENRGRIRVFWNASGERLDRIRRNIPDKRLRKKISAMPRTDYKAIISELVKNRLINEEAGKKSVELHDLFMRYRKLNALVPNSVVAAMEVLNDMLAEELRDEPEETDLQHTALPGSDTNARLSQTSAEGNHSEV
jgi:hypothetical protein